MKRDDAADWTPVIAGVDGSAESVRAAALAVAVAERAGVPCVPVAALDDYAHRLGSRDAADDAGGIARELLERDHRWIHASLRGAVSESVADALESTVGKAPAVLADAARRHGASLIVVGSRPRRLFDRFRGSIVDHLARTSDVPVLVAGGAAAPILRILVALDLSWASVAAWREARRWRRLFGAHLRVLHVIEPSPPPPISAGPFDDGFLDAMQRAEAGQRDVSWSDIDEHEAGKVVRHGAPAAAIAAEVAAWRADLLIIASHGRGWVDRMLLGSTTDALLRRRPASLLIVPAGRPAGADRVPAGVAEAAAGRI